MEHFRNKNFSLPVYLFSCFPADPGCCTPGTSVSWTFCITVILIMRIHHIHYKTTKQRLANRIRSAADRIHSIRGLAAVSARQTQRLSASPVYSILCCLPGFIESLFLCFPVSLFLLFLYRFYRCTGSFHSPLCSGLPILHPFNCLRPLHNKEYSDNCPDGSDLPVCR